MEFVAS